MSDANQNFQPQPGQDDAEHDAAPVFFHASLTPHRSMGRTGHLIVIGIIGAVCFGGGLLFASMGAWPIVGFLGLDVALVWYAFRRSYGQARAFEEVSLSANEVVLTKVAENGARQVYRFNPFWVRLTVTRIEDEGVTALELTSHGKSVPLGAFLNPPDRASFASVFAQALAAARTGRPLGA